VPGYLRRPSAARRSLGHRDVVTGWLTELAARLDPEDIFPATPTFGTLGTWLHFATLYEPAARGSVCTHGARFSPVIHHGRRLIRPESTGTGGLCARVDGHPAAQEAAERPDDCSRSRKLPNRVTRPQRRSDPELP
jgi:hypothetical protein